MKRNSFMFYAGAYAKILNSHGGKNKIKKYSPLQLSMKNSQNYVNSFKMSFNEDKLNLCAHEYHFYVHDSMMYLIYKLTSKRNLSGKIFTLQLIS